MSEGPNGQVEERAGDGGGAEFERVKGELLNRLTNGTYALNSNLPPQRDLAVEFGVSRDTVQRVLKTLVNERWIESRRGSGSRVIRTGSLIPSVSGDSVSLGAVIDKAFERDEVVLDVFTLTSETLNRHIDRQEQRIRGGLVPAPHHIALRMLLPAENLRERPYPEAVDPQYEEAVHQRLLETTQWNTAAIHTKLYDLRAERKVKDVDLEVRHVRLTPTLKLYLLNGEEVLFAPYMPVERPVNLRALDKDVQAIDVEGFGAPFTYIVKDSSEDSQASAAVTTWQSWFDKVWDVLASE
ncbi:winged helix-turn-helix domain-containing protein [Streptomyces sp. NPDC049541]|uniref:winged helix-turn-helix domain-containing protein n=1 Tax=Streptomyces sp. NPDC049541 TaxID=3365594 RepID=UPI00378921B2